MDVSARYSPNACAQAPLRFCDRSEPDGAQCGLALMDWVGRAVLLVDLDAFFASVEQLDHPAWRGKPVIVGGDPGRRGVVSTASYEARAFGVHSAMPSSQAARLCPDALWTPGNFERYREVSNEVMSILTDETPYVDQVSIDEAFCDVTPNRTNREHPASIAQRIQQRVFALGVTCSIGLGTTKTVAKLASEEDKPRGLTVIYPGTERSFLDPKPTRALSGIGEASARVLQRVGIETLGDLACADDDLVVRLLGKNGRTMLERVRGEEPGAVRPQGPVKSISNEVSFAEDLNARADLEAAIHTMGAKVCRRLRRRQLAGRTITLKLRYANRSLRTVQGALAQPSDDESVIVPFALNLLDEVWTPGAGVRLVGIAATGFNTSCAVQESLFDVGADDGERRWSQAHRPPAPEQKSGAHTAAAKSLRSLAQATDKVRERFGETSVSYGRELRCRDMTTGSSAKNPADYN